MELSSVFGGDTLKAADLQGTEPVVIISSVEMKKFDNGNKLVVTFQGKKKVLVCNKTNANRIAHVHGTNTDNWIGKEIILFTDLVDFQGKTVEAIRIRPVPKRAKQYVDDQRQEAIADARPQTQPMKQSIQSGDLDDEIPFHAEFR
jgi:hypothetical protein